MWLCAKRWVVVGVIMAIDMRLWRIVFRWLCQTKVSLSFGCIEAYRRNGARRLRRSGHSLAQPVNLKNFI